MSAYRCKRCRSGLRMVRLGRIEGLLCPVCDESDDTVLRPGNDTFADWLAYSWRMRSAVGSSRAATYHAIAERIRRVMRTAGGRP